MRICRLFAGASLLILLFCFAVAAAMAAPATAQQVGIAFAIAPEQSVGHCVGGNATATLDCARARCAEGGARPQDCLRVTWCYPAGWSATIAVQHREGLHWTEFTCGWETRAAVEEAVALECRDREMIEACELGEIRDPVGALVPAD
jgi:hypothetical protein